MTKSSDYSLEVSIGRRSLGQVYVCIRSQGPVGLILTQEIDAACETVAN